MLYDLKHYGLGAAWFNVRFLLAWRLAQFLIRRPIRLQVHD